MAEAVSWYTALFLGGVTGCLIVRALTTGDTVLAAGLVAVAALTAILIWSMGRMVRR